MNAAEWVEMYERMPRGPETNITQVRLLLYPYGMITTKVDDARSWCKQTIENRDFINIAATFYFKNENDAMMFKLACT